jgi:hypothetical protein
MPEAPSISWAACSVAETAPDTASTRPLTSWLARDVCSMLRAISWVVAVCSSTAEATPTE